MGLMQNYFPVFEANQVLTSGHLNDVFNYLDEQERLTRSNLIGIGIVCGLNIKLDGTTIHLSKGCGVTSQGYLIVEPEDVALVAYRANYTIPSDPDYPPFKDTASPPTQYPLWELFPAGEPNTIALNSPANFLDDKAVVLFLELKQQGLRNCSPNNCDDKGSQVTAVVKRLLIRRPDLDQIIAAAKALGGGLTAGELEAALLEKLNLPDLRVPRFDVLNSSPVTSNDVYAAFLRVFGGGQMAQATGAALGAGYAAFQPVLQDSYPTNPFVNFDATYGFLDSAPTTPAQVRFLQYYVDLFDDLLRAYDEFRWSGIELICACCPPDGLFPRHLMLGLLHPENANEPEIYRQGFLPSAAVGDCIEQTKELLQLFQRLVEIAACFTNVPALPAANPQARMDPQIRITPSVIGCKPLADRAIPYYYQENGDPPLYRLWSVEKTRRNRANRNLGYRFDEYSPPAPAFVSSPLSYDLEPYNFLRVEGCLGKNYVQALQTLLLMRSEYRLPVEFIALRSGAYDDSLQLDLSKQTACFQDLQAVYDALREELLSSLAEGTRFLYDIPVANLTLPGGTPNLPLLKDYASNYQYAANSVGAWYEKYLTSLESRPYIDFNPDQVDVNSVLMVYCALFANTQGLPSENFADAVSIYYFSKLAEIVPDKLDALAYADFERRFEDMLALVRYFRSDAINNVSADLKSFIPQEQLIEHFDEVLFSCKLDPIKAIHNEYLKRIGDLRKRQFLSQFLLEHPAIQHKAGVPVGGTFILVYHGEPAAPVGEVDLVQANAAAIAERMAADQAATTAMKEAPAAAVESLASAKAADTVKVGAPKALFTTASSRNLALADAISRIASNQTFALNPDIGLVLGSLTGKIPISGVRRPVFGIGDGAAKIIAETVDGLKDGDVIADFYLPYLVSCDCCSAVQFVLPMTPPTIDVEVGCTDPEGTASVTVTVKGGVQPYDVNVDKAGYQPLGPTLSLSTGTHSLTVRDAEGIESDPQLVTVAAPLTVSEPPVFVCNADFTAYTATFQISGGTLPYTVNGRPIDGAAYTSDSVPSGQSVSVDVVDYKQCKTSVTVTHTCEKPPCDLPCEGIALRRGYRFWLPSPAGEAVYKSLIFERVVFSFEFPDANTSADLSQAVQGVVRANTTADLNSNFDNTVSNWCGEINKLIEARTNKPSWLTLSYERGQPGGLGTLWIEHFKCLTFDISFASTLQRPEAVEHLNLFYAPGGTSVEKTGAGSDVKLAIPAFDGTQTDKCNPQIPVEALCAKTPDLTLKIDKQVTGMTAKLSVTAAGSDQPAAYLWEIQDADPPLAEGQGVTVTFTSAQPATKVVTVTAFTEGGCRVIAKDTITIVPGFANHARRKPRRG